MKRIFIGAASLLMSFTLSAAEVGSEDVELVAKGWVRDNAQAFGQMGAFQSVKAELDAAGQPLWYWVVMEKGSVIVAPDDEIDPIIAMLPGCRGELPAKHPMLALLRRDLTQRRAYAQALAAQQTGPRLMAVQPSKAAMRWQRLKQRGDLSKPSLLAAAPTPSRIIAWLPGFNSVSDGDGTTLRFWNQDASPAYFADMLIFNQFTPEFGDFIKVPAPCGCVATAGATVLHYLNVTSCVANVARECTLAGIGKTNLYTTGGIYDWSLVPARPGPGEDPVSLESEAPAALELLGRVASDVGIACHMSYGPEESGAFTFDLAYALRTDFGLASARVVNENGPSGGNVAPIQAKHYEKLVYNQIRGGSPVIFGISYSKGVGGHEVVAVGYGQDDANKDFTFIFTGWGGTGDAWYALPDIDTKATVGGNSYTYDVIGDMITQLDRDGRSVPIVGRVTDKTTGLPVADAWVWLADGTQTKTDANGYYGLRVDPQTPTKVVYDPSGRAHSFTVGETAYAPDVKTLKEGSAGYVSAEVLARALPDVMNFEIDSAQIVEDPSAVTFHTDYDTAVRLALAQGKPLYVFGSAAGDPAVDVYMAYLRTLDTTVLNQYVFLHLDNISQNGVAYATVDPRVFDPTKEIIWWDKELFGTTGENKVWIVDYEDAGNVGAGFVKPENWDSSDCQVTAAEISGPDLIVSQAGKTGAYAMTVTFSDGKKETLKHPFVTWEVDRVDACSIDANGLLTPVQGAFAEVTVTAKVSSGGVETPVSKTVWLMPDTAVVIGGSSEADPLVVPADPADENVTSNAFAVARDGNVLPSFDDNVISDITPGKEVTLTAKREWTLENEYKLRCVRPVILTGDVVRVEMPVPMTVTTNDGQVVGTFVPEALTNYVQWVWETGSCRVNVEGVSGVADVDRGNEWVSVDEPLVVNVTLKDPDAAAVWTGCVKSELATPTQAVIGVKWSRRDVAVSAQKTNTEFTVAKDLAPAVGPGYVLELVEEGETENTYKVNKSQGGEIVTPGPIAFKSITRVDATTWKLVVTNIVEFCNYRLIYTDDLKRGFSVTGNWQQATGPMVPTWTTNVVTSGEQLFWRAEAKEGEKK